MEAIAPILDGAIASNYYIGEFRGNGDQAGDSLFDIIYEITGAEEDGIVRAVVEQLIDDDPADYRDGGEPFYQDDQYYVRHSDISDPHSEAWEQFKIEITYNRRFFSELARERLSKIFDKIHLQKDSSGKPVVYSLAVDDSLKIFRARQIDTEKERIDALKEPGNLLGSPPQRLRVAGRMNAAGVRAFYGAFDIDTCIAEIRPSVGARIVGASFSLIRPIVVLDTTRFSRPILSRSIFSPVYLERLQQWNFMQQFMYEISQPILPEDVMLDYIPSQAVSEYIHSVLSVHVSGKRCGIDAIIFGSAQRPEGKNIVLFGDAALVENTQSIDDQKKYESKETSDDEFWMDWTLEEPRPALRVDPIDAQVHYITGARYTHAVSFETLQADFDYDF